MIGCTHVTASATACDFSPPPLPPRSRADKLVSARTVCSIER